MRHWRHIFVPIYNENLYWIQCSANYFVRKVRAEFGEMSDLSGTTNGKFETHNKQDTMIGCLWLPTKDVVAHEVFHSVCWIFDIRGITLTDASEECYAYLLSYICDEIFKEIK